MASASIFQFYSQYIEENKKKNGLEEEMGYLEKSKQNEVQAFRQVCINITETK